MFLGSPFTMPQSNQQPGAANKATRVSRPPAFVVPNVKVAGLVSPGNINLYDRPSVRNPYTGGVSSVWSMGIYVDGKEVLIPRVSDDGRILSEKEAIDMFRKTGRHLGMFNSIENANAYAKLLHEQQALLGGQ